MYVFEALSYDFRLVICTGFVCLIKSMVIGNQEGRVQHETRLGKEEFRQRRNSPGNTKSIGQWSQERIYLLSICKLLVGLVV